MRQKWLVILLLGSIFIGVTSLPTSYSKMEICSECEEWVFRESVACVRACSEAYDICREKRLCEAQGDKDCDGSIKKELVHDLGKCPPQDNRCVYRVLNKYLPANFKSKHRVCAKGDANCDGSIKKELVQDIGRCSERDTACLHGVLNKFMPEEDEDESKDTRQRKCAKGDADCDGSIVKEVVQDVRRCSERDTECVFDALGKYVPDEGDPNSQLYHQDYHETRDDGVDIRHFGSNDGSDGHVDIHLSDDHRRGYAPRHDSDTYGSIKHHDETVDDTAVHRYSQNNHGHYDQDYRGHQDTTDKRSYDIPHGDHSDTMLISRHGGRRSGNDHKHDNQESSRFQNNRHGFTNPNRHDPNIRNNKERDRFSRLHGRGSVHDHENDDDLEFKKCFQEEFDTIAHELLDLFGEDNSSSVFESFSKYIF